MKRRIVRWLLRVLGYDAPHMNYPELFAICGSVNSADFVSTDRARAFMFYEREHRAGSRGVSLIRYVPAERILA